MAAKIGVCLVDSYLSKEQIQELELDVLCRAADFFNENEITYSLCYGSLIGAVRHKGFIPWDDDIDLFLPRNSYERLIGLADSFERQTGLILEGIRGLSLEDSPIIKACNPSILTLERGVTEPEHLWVDLFPIDGVPEDEASAKKLCSRAKWLGFAFTARTSPVSSAIGMKRKLVKALMKVVFAYKSPAEIAKELNANARTYRTDEVPFAANLTFSYNAYSGRFRFGADEPMVEMEFEGRNFPVIADWDTALRGGYGDYMVIPPVEKQMTHSLRAWVAGDNN